MKGPYRIEFPKESFSQGEDITAYFYLYDIKEKRVKIGFHDYKKIYSYPGLYEQLFYDRLKTASHRATLRVLKKVLSVEGKKISQLRVLDIGAGNGIMGHLLRKESVSRLVGLDILPEAKTAAERDYPGTYDAYYVMDLARITQQEREELLHWKFTCICIVAALGYGHLSVDALDEAISFLSKDGYFVCTMRERFLNPAYDEPYAKAVRQRLFSSFFQLCHVERYCHRLSIEGKPIIYAVVVLKKV